MLKYECSDNIFNILTDICTTYAKTTQQLNENAVIVSDQYVIALKLSIAKLIYIYSLALDNTVTSSQINLLKTTI